jgi:hypothetical protein
LGDPRFARPGSTSRPLARAAFAVSAEAQREAVATLRAIEEEWVSGDYHATPEELEAIDQADRSGVATEDEVEVAFSTFRAA